jgi:SOS-response transcriptional repressor LexA
MIPVYSMASLLSADKKSDELTSFNNIETNAGEQCIAIKLNDEAMSPIFPERTIIIIDPSKQVQNGCYAIFHIKSLNEAVFRQVIFDESDAFLKALHPDITRFKIRRLSDEDTCYGILVQAKLNYF